MKRRIIIVILFSCLFYTIGGGIGNKFSTFAEDVCDSPTDGSITINSCTTTKYMGGKWYKGTVNFRSFADISSVQNAASYSRSHFEGVSGITITSWNGTGNNQLGVFDEAHSYDSWTGLAEGSYIDGQYPDEYYYAIDIIINTRNSNGTNASEYPTSTLRGLVNHEFGHAFGIGHSTTSSRLMYCYDSRTSVVLTSTERGYLEDIY